MGGTSDHAATGTAGRTRRGGTRPGTHRSLPGQRTSRTAGRVASSGLAAPGETSRGLSGLVVYGFLIIAALYVAFLIGEAIVLNR